MIVLVFIWNCYILFHFPWNKNKRINRHPHRPKTCHEVWNPREEIVIDQKLVTKFEIIMFVSLKRR